MDTATSRPRPRTRKPPAEKAAEKAAGKASAEKAPAKASLSAKASTRAAGVDVPTSVRDRLPDSEHLVYYGGLGALTAFGLVSWPVAAAIGVGVWLAGRGKQAG